MDLERKVVSESNQGTEIGPKVSHLLSFSPVTSVYTETHEGDVTLTANKTIMRLG